MRALLVIPLAVLAVGAWLALTQPHAVPEASIKPAIAYVAPTALVCPPPPPLVICPPLPAPPPPARIAEHDVAIDLTTSKPVAAGSRVRITFHLHPDGTLTLKDVR